MVVFGTKVFRILKNEVRQKSHPPTVSQLGGTLPETNSQLAAET